MINPKMVDLFIFFISLSSGNSFPHRGCPTFKQFAKVIHFSRIMTHYEEFKPLFCVFCAVYMFWSGQ